MKQNAELEIRNLSEVGEDIGLEKGLEMIVSYKHTFPETAVCHYIGKNIIDKILAQPGCVGINFRKGLNATGTEHLIYTGVDANGKDILSLLAVEQDGRLIRRNAIVAERDIIVIDGDSIEEMIRKILGL